MKPPRPKANQQGKASHRPWSRYAPLLMGLAIVAATFAAHFPAIQGGYIWDDGAFLYDNPIIRSPSGLYDFWFTTHAADYWPLTSTMFWIEWRIWGNNPTAYHTGNIALQAIAAVLLWRVLRRLNISGIGAFLAALFFAIHPVTVESVAWIAERKNLLSMVLCLLSILAYLRFEDQGRQKWYVLALLAAAATLFAKTSMVALPVVLLLLTWWRRKPITKWTILRTVPFFLISLALGLITIWFQHFKAIDKWVVRPEGLASQIASVGWIAWFYLYKLFVPVNLAMTYPRWDIDGHSIISFVPLALLIACFAAFWYGRKSWGRGPLAALGAFVIILAPVLGMLDMAYMRYSLVADHLQYAGIPAVMALIGGGMGAAWSWARRESKFNVAAGAAIGVHPETRVGPASHVGPASSRSSLMVLGCTLITLLITATLGVLTFHQAQIYHNEVTLWTHTIALNPDAWHAYNNRCNAYNGLGDFDAAIQDCTKAMQMRPDLAEAHSNRGSAYAQKGDYDQAIRDCNDAIAIKPDCEGAFVYRGNAYSRMGDLDQAIRDYDKAIEIKPDFAEAYSNRASIYGRKGLFDQSIQDCNKAIELNPDYADAYIYRGNAYVATGAIDQALQDFNKAVELKPTFANAYNNRGNAYGRKGAFHEAIQDFSKAIELKPDFAEPYRTRAASYYNIKEYDKAWADLKTFQQLGGTPSPDLLQKLTKATGRTE